MEVPHTVTTDDHQNSTIAERGHFLKRIYRRSYRYIATDEQFWKEFPQKRDLVSERQWVLSRILSLRREHTHISTIALGNLVDEINKRAMPSGRWIETTKNENDGA